MKIETICPVTKRVLFISDIKPGLLRRGARGDWGYSTKYEQAVELTDGQALQAIRDMTYCGRQPRILAQGS